ncbi:hypothetical protein S83_062608, partial [Arachis hypogaea]
NKPFKTYCKNSNCLHLPERRHPLTSDRHQLPSLHVEGVVGSCFVEVCPPLRCFVFLDSLALQPPLSSTTASLWSAIKELSSTWALISKPSFDPVTREKDTIATIANSATIKEVAAVVYSEADTLLRKEKQGLTFTWPFLAFLVTSQKKAVQ